MEESILKFAEQFSYEPEIQNSGKLKKEYKNFILDSMGGSSLAVKILRDYDPSLNLYINSSYGVPKYDDEFEKSLLIANSYSGNTEEAIDFADEAYSRGHDLLIISTGGKLIDFAKNNKLPYIKIPDTGIQPRVALGYSTLSIVKIIAPGLLDELQTMSQLLKPENIKKDGKELSEVLKNKIPIIYTSTKNKSLGYIWKIKMNETGKIPAFNNVFPELNHNEMQGFDFIESNKKLSEYFHFIFIVDTEDHKRVLKRMEVTEELLQEKGLSVNKIYLYGQSRWEKIFNSILLADWTALGLSQVYGTEAEQVPLIEDFKKRIK